MENDETPSGPRYSERTLDLESLKALAHPLRLKIVDVLSTYGSFTASGLAERLGESSGATSYHLRQLEKHGFVREVEGKGTGRERWWERVPGGLNLNTTQLEDSPVARAASSIVMRQWKQNRDQLLGDFVDHGYNELSSEWIEASTVSTANVRLTWEQLAALTSAWQEFSLLHIEPFRGQDVAGSRPIQVHFNAFPIVDGQETPRDSDDKGDTKS
jgi:DNA-binding transcriptional ArsR family regulator